MFFLFEIALTDKNRRPGTSPDVQVAADTAKSLFNLYLHLKGQLIKDVTLYIHSRIGLDQFQAVRGDVYKRQVLWRRLW